MYKHLIYILLLMLLPQILATESYARNDKKGKRKIELPGTPEPDPYIEIHRDKKLAESPVARHGRRIIHAHREGIDVSHYQQSINWANVAKTNTIGYAFVKATESNYYIDDYYEENMAEGKKNGIYMGSYHFFRANVNMKEQFEHMISVIDPKKQDLLPIIDVEAANGVPVSTFVQRLKEFLRMVEKHYGRPPILYTYVNFYEKYLVNRGFDHYPLMIAYYNEDTPYLSDGKEYIMWQYTCRGRISGIKGDVDRSRFVENFNINDILYQR